MALAFYSNANGQTPSLEKSCDDIKMVFDVARFRGEYKTRVYGWLNNKCRGAIPLPNLNDAYNVQRFNTSAGILQSGGGISIAPD